MNKLALDFQPVRTLLDDPQLNKFKGVLKDPRLTPAIDAFLDALDRPDVVLAMILAPVFAVPGIVPACVTLRENRAFEAAVQRNDNLKKFIGAVTKMRAKSIGLVKTGRKGRVAQWVGGFTVAEIYQPTAALWSVFSFTPSLPKGTNVFGILGQDEGSGT
jgi:hypothetical protein